MDVSTVIELWKDYEPEAFLEQKNPRTGLWEPAVGLVNLTFRIAATEQGTAIGALVGIPAVERLDSPGRYAGAVDLSLLTSELPALTYPHNSYVYLQLYKAGDIQVEAFKLQLKRTKY